MKDDSLILKVHGAAAGDFLREQLTVDMDALSRGHWTHAVYCAAGRAALAWLWVFPWTGGILLRLPRSVASTFLAHIRPHIHDRDVHFSVTGLCFGAISEGRPNPAPVLYTAGDSITLIGGVRGITPYIGEYPAAKSLDADAWYAARIRAGIPEIYADTAGHFLPPMLDSSGGDMACAGEQAQHCHLARATAAAFASGCRTLYHKHSPAGTILDYGHDKQGSIVQAVVEDRYLGKVLRTRDEDTPLVFQRVTEK